MARDPSEEWRPTARLEALHLRARLLREVREYFREQGVLEVETPVIAAHAVTDVQLASLKTRVQGYGDFHLQTSPEYAMKRLLAAGAPDLYQVARVFRDAERGALHNPEFTLVEWYRLGFDAAALMDEAARLLHRLFEGIRSLGPPERLTYAQAFARHAGIGALGVPNRELAACAMTHGVAPAGAASLDRDGWLDLLMSTVIGPKLGHGHLTFVHEYPASQAALARINPEDPRVAARFEIYFDGIELANGFHELTDPGEQRRRFERDVAERKERGLPAVTPDERLLAALEHGLPDCSGVALGFDRVVMLAAGAKSIEQVMAFPIERA